MLAPQDLYDVVGETGTDADLVMVVALDGFIDAGGATRLAREHLLDVLESEVVAEFDLDQLLDYRSRRPLLLFDRDHWESYEEPRLRLHRVTGTDGAPFLLLAGREPDVQWERFVAAVGELALRLGVRLTVGLGAIPFAVPHTRPLGVTVHGSRRELVAGYPSWIDQVQVPASVAHLLEFRRGRAGHDAMGVAVHVPQYLASAEFPVAAAVLLETVAATTGLALPVEALQAAGSRTREEIDEQVSRSEEVAGVVRRLEEQYDALVQAQGRTTLLGQGFGALPTADEIGDELERFLAGQEGREPPTR